MKSNRRVPVCQGAVASHTVGKIEFAGATALPPSRDRGAAPRRTSGAMWALLALVLFARPSFAAFPNGYGYCKVVTTRNTMVSGSSDLANYPLTVILTDADLKTTANGGLVNNANGYDIGFYPDCSGSGTALKWEMESYTPATGAIVAHVLRPTLSHTANDTIGMYYGAAFSTFQSTASAVWDTSYKGVWHLASTAAADSTGNGHDGTSVSMTSSAGQVGNGLANNGAQNAILDAIPATRSVAHLTVSIWVKPSTLTDLDTYIQDSGDSDVDVSKQTFDLLASTSGLGGSSNRDVILALYGSTVDTYGYTTAGNILTSGAWTHLAMVFDGTQTGNSNRLKGYANGQPLSLTFSDVIGATTLANSQKTVLGQGISQTRNFHGTLDEARIATASRSADWVLTEYRNQSAPGTYITAGPRLSPVNSHVRHSVRGGI